MKSSDEDKRRIIRLNRIKVLKDKSVKVKLKASLLASKK